MLQERVYKLGLLILLLLGCASAADGAQAGSARRPNFVFILVDDMGWTDLGCQGSQFYETPNIDRLAASGMRFTSGYAAAPVCSPTRSSILTGKFPARTGNTDWFGAGKRSGKLLPAPYINHLPAEEHTLAQALRAAGYRTASIGKWHLGGTGFEPTRFGFELNLAGTASGSPKSYFSPFHIPTLKDGPPGEELTDRLTTEALRFIESNKDQPFFLYLPFFAVHTPLQSKKELVTKYQKKAEKLGVREPFQKDGTTKVRQIHDHAVYAGLVETVDSNVGRILAKLRELQLDENTVVIFTSDNGGLATSEGWPTSNRPLRMGKGWLYEGGIRVPWIIRWPGHTGPGSTSDHPVISTDFYPTLLEMAGLKLLPKQHSDGVSNVPLLKGTGKLADRALYWHYPHYSNQFGTPSGAVRVGNHVLIEFFEDGKLELYDVVKDIGQQHNLARGMPELATRLQRQLREWREGMQARMPRKKG